MGLSKKQLAIMRFPYSKYDALIADGAVRAGKTSIMSMSFVLWAMGSFNNCYFAICGKSVGAVTRNILNPLLTITYLQKEFDLDYHRSEHCLIVRRGQKVNHFYFFGGKDESSYQLIQGMTLAGVLLDEVALMPRSFVEQALARCSVEGSKFWFNCNPENPRHWFRMEWLLQLDKHNAMHLHFTMDDNPSLSETMKQRYKTQYSGVFYKRYIEGLWVMAEGVIYDMFDSGENVYRPDERPVDLYWSGDRTIAIDYGTTNPMRFLDIYDYKGKLYVDREYNWDSRAQFAQKTDSEYADDLAVFMGKRDCPIIIDPSAASFIAECQRRGWYVIPADNEVVDGIRKTGALVKKREILVCSECEAILDEFGTYIWDDKAAQRGEEKPVKQNDHSLDALRYRVNALPDWRFE
jgi:PBSX family phage terminase large subunit